MAPWVRAPRSICSPLEREAQWAAGRAWASLPPQPPPFSPPTSHPCRGQRQHCLSISLSRTRFPHLFSFLIYPWLLKGLIRKM